jgi:hypothetical protein
MYTVWGGPVHVDLLDHKLSVSATDENILQQIEASANMIK